MSTLYLVPVTKIGKIPSKIKYIQDFENKSVCKYGNSMRELIFSYKKYKNWIVSII